MKLFQLALLLTLGYFIYKVFKGTRRASRRKGFREPTDSGKNAVKKGDRIKYNSDNIEDADFEEIE